METVTAADVRAIFPVLLLFTTAIAVLVFDLFRQHPPGAEGKDGFGPAPMSPVLHLFAACGGVLALVAILAGWDARPGVWFSGALRIDVFSNTLSGVIVLVATLTCAASAGYLRRRGIEDGEFHALVLASAGAMVLLVESNSLVLLFLSLETLSLGVYVLTGSTHFERRSVEGALKYLILGGFSSAFLLLGLALLYGATGELRLDTMTDRIAAGAADGPLLVAGSALVVVGFAFKTGAFPFHSWIPDAYEGAPTLVTAFMSTAVKTAAFGALTRMALGLFGALPPDGRGAIVWVLAALAIATMVFANTVAAVQSSAKRMLAYSGIAHTGYLMVGVVSALSIEGGRYFDSRGSSVVFYLLPYSLMTFGAFLVMASLGQGTQDAESLDSFRGLSRRRPLIALAMLLFMVSLAGIPPTAGFWAKLYLFREAVSAGRWDLALIGILTSILAAYYYLRLVVVMYMQPAPSEARHGRRAAPPPPPAPLLPPTPAEDLAAWTAPAAIGLAAAGILWIGLLPSGFLAQSVRSIQSILARL